MKKILKLKNDNWDGKGCSLWVAQSPSGHNTTIMSKDGDKSTSVSIFISETNEFWSVSIWIYSIPHFTANESLDITFFYFKHPTIQNCIAAAMLYANKFVRAQKNNLKKKIDKDFDHCINIINAAYLETRVKMEKK